MENSQVVHLWANQSKGHAKTGNGNLSFNGNVLLSYTTEIGRIYTNGIVVYTSYRHSVTTTGKHLIHIPNAVSHLDSYRVSCPMADIPTDWESAAPIIFTNLLSKFNEHIQALRKVRSDIITRMSVTERLAHDIRDITCFVDTSLLNSENMKLRDLARVFFTAGSDGTYVTNADLVSQLLEFGIDLPAKLVKENEARQARMAQDLIKQQRLIEEQKEKIADWRAGIFDGNLYDIPPMLRIRDGANSLQTSHGAKVPLQRALDVFKLLNQGENIKGLQIGDFFVNEVTDIYVKVGCHTILLTEINNFFQSLTL